MSLHPGTISHRVPAQWNQQKILPAEVNMSRGRTWLPQEVSWQPVPAGASVPWLVHSSGGERLSDTAEDTDDHSGATTPEDLSVSISLTIFKAPPRAAAFPVNRCSLQLFTWKTPVTHQSSLILKCTFFIVVLDSLSSTFLCYYIFKYTKKNELHFTLNNKSLLK